MTPGGMPRDGFGSGWRINRCSICRRQSADGLLSAAKGISIDMFALQNNVAFKWRCVRSLWRYVDENALIGPAALI